MRLYLSLVTKLIILQQIGKSINILRLPLSQYKNIIIIIAFSAFFIYVRSGYIPSQSIQFAIFFQVVIGRSKPVKSPWQSEIHIIIITIHILATT